MKKALSLLTLFLCVFVSSVALAQEEISDVFASPTLSLKRPADRDKIVQRIRAIENKRLNATKAKARILGLKMRNEKPDGSVQELFDFEGNNPVYIETFNENAAISTGANLLRTAPYGLDGTGVTVGVWDQEGGRPTHVEFATSSGSRLTNMDGPVTNFHSMHVAGTIAAFGVDAPSRGMANAARIDSYNWNFDMSEMTSRGATAPGQLATMLYLSNHSYGNSAGWVGNLWTGNGLDQNDYAIQYGRYNSSASNMDSVAYNAPYLLSFWAAGNERNDNPGTGSPVSIGGETVAYNPAIHPPGDGKYRNGYETISTYSLAKNIITVGGVDDAVLSGVRNLSRAYLYNQSSTGPTDDGRIKPDLVANGVSVRSTYDNSDTAYNSISGTSMATPNACGSAALLVDQYNRLFSGAMRSSTLKALLIHTADDLGNPGPDYIYGWGLVNVKEAADLLIDHKAFPTKKRLTENQVSSSVTSRTQPFLWDGVSPIKATIAWTDPAGASTIVSDSRTPRLKNDLNLKLIAPNGTIYYPFVMPFVGTWTVASMSQNATTGINNTDNVEQVIVSAPSQTGNWEAVVTYTGTLTNNVQDYGLIMSGVIPIGPEIVIEQPVNNSLAAGSASVSCGSVNVGSSSSPVTFTIRNTGTADLTGLAVSKNGINSTDFSIGSLGATTLAPDQTTTFAVTFTPGTAGTKTATIHVASNDTDENPFDIIVTGTAVGPGTLNVTPPNIASSAGQYGGTFSPSVISYTLNNPGNTSIAWTAASTANWTTLSATSGTLAAGGSAVVTATINGYATSLNVGSYTNTVSFTNSTNNSGSTTRDISLTVNPIAASVNLSGLAQTYDGSPKPITVTTTPSGLSHSVTYDGSATAPTNAGTYAVVATVTEPNYQGSASGNLVIAYTVNYLGNGNTSGTVPADQTKLQGVNLTLANNTGNLNKTGFSFAGWNTAADGNGTSYPTGTSYSGNASLTLYAKWVPGADGTWTQTTAGPFDWGTAGNWSGGTVASGADRTANFTPNITAAQVVNLESAWTIGNITFTDSTTASHDLTISGANVLALVRSSGMPTINVTNRTLTVSSQISGTNGLQKDGSGTLTLTGANDLSGGLLMNAGTVSVTTASLNNNTITVNGTATLSAVTSTTSGGINLNPGSSLFFGAITSNTLTVNGVVTGGGALTVGRNGPNTHILNLLNSGNDFTGAIFIGPSIVTNINTQTLTVKSIGDSSASAITFGYGNTTNTTNSQIFAYTGSSALTLNNRYFEFGPINTAAANGSGTIDASGATGATLTIMKDLIVSGTGGGFTKNLTLTGTNTDNNTFAGNIADGNGTPIRIVKTGAGIWNVTGNMSHTGGLSVSAVSGGALKLSGTNTYSGTTVNAFSNPASGGLTFQGIRSLPNSTTLQQTHSGGTGGFGVIKILDDSATPASRSGTDIAMLATTSSNIMSIFVGNNNTANGGTSSATTIGSTIQLGNLTLTQNAAGSASQTFAVTGGNGYRLQIGGIVPTLNASNTANYTAILNPTTAPLTVAGNVQQTASGGAGSTVTLSLDGTASGNLISGNVMDGADGKLLRLTKSSAGTWVLTGSNTYTGVTTISGGTLQLGDGTAGKDGTIANTSGITNNATLVFNRFGALSSSVDISGSGAVTKTGAGSQTLAGTNTYTGVTTVSEGKLFINGSLSNVAVALNVNSGATLGGTGTIGRNITIAAGGKLEFNLSTNAASHGRLDVSTGRSLAFSGASELNITSGGGSSPGIYTLITGGNNITGPAPATVNLPAGWAGTVSISGNSLLLNVTSTGGPGPVDHFAISAIGSTQTVGTPITSITLTAQDASNATATGFSGNVTYGGTGGFTGSSASFVAGVLSNVSVTPTVAGGDLTFTVNDGSGHTGTATITTIQTQYAAWAGTSAFGADSNGDGVENGLAWVLGAANPNANAIGLLPTLSTSGGNMVFSFKRNQASINANTAVAIQMGSTLGSWPNDYTVGATTAASSPGVSVAKDTPAAGTDTITLSVAQSPDTKKFARLKVMQTP